jgi:hypothetical protein
MFDGELATSNSFAAKALLAVTPSAQVVLYGFQHHAQPPAANATIGEQVNKLLFQFNVIRPVATAGLG